MSVWSHGATSPFDWTVEMFVELHGCWFQTESNHRVDGLMLELKDDDDRMILSLSEADSSKEQRFDQNQRERHN